MPSSDPIGFQILASPSGYELNGFAGVVEHVKQTHTVPVTRHTGPLPRPELRHGSVDSGTAEC